MTSLPARQDGLADVSLLGALAAVPVERAAPERKPVYIGLDLDGPEEAAGAFLRMALSLYQEPPTFSDEAIRDDGPLTTPQLANALGWSLPKTRRMLTAGVMPGCYKENPAKKGSHWYIPANTPARFKRGERGEGAQDGA